MLDHRCSGSLSFHQGQITAIERLLEARQLLERARSTFSNTGDDERLASANIYSASVSAMLGEYKLAHEQLDLGRAYFSRVEAGRGLLWCDLVFAAVLVEEGRPDEALPVLDKLAGSAEVRDDWVLRGEIEEKQAEACRRLGIVERELAHMRRARAIYCEAKVHIRMKAAEDKLVARTKSYESK